MVSIDDKVNNIATRAMSEGEGDPSLTVAAIRKLLEAVGSEAEAFWRGSPAPYQSTQNSNNLEAHIRSFVRLYESAGSLKETMQQRFVMGIKMARFSMTKNLENFRVTLDRMSMAAKYVE
jgi:hypothetical protein